MERQDRVVPLRAEDGRDEVGGHDEGRREAGHEQQHGDALAAEPAELETLALLLEAGVGRQEHGRERQGDPRHGQEHDVVGERVRAERRRTLDTADEQLVEIQRRPVEHDGPGDLRAKPTENPRALAREADVRSPAGQRVHEDEGDDAVDEPVDDDRPRAETGERDSDRGRASDDRRRHVAKLQAAVGELPPEQRPWDDRERDEHEAERGNREQLAHLGLAHRRGDHTGGRDSQQGQSEADPRRQPEHRRAIVLVDRRALDQCDAQGGIREQQEEAGGDERQ